MRGKDNQMPAQESGKPGKRNTTEVLRHQWNLIMV